MAWLNDVRSGLGVMFENPWFLLLGALALGLSYWLNSRASRAIAKNQAATNEPGWTQSAATAQRPTDIGVGFDEVLVLKLPSKALRVGVLSIAFFGGGAIFYWLQILSDAAAQTAKNWLVFASLTAFAVAGLFVVIMTFSRTEIGKTSITRRRLFRKNKQHFLSSITNVAPVGQNPATGIVLSFADGQSLRLLATNQGYAQALAALAPAHPDIAKYYAAGRLARKLRQSN